MRRIVLSLAILFGLGQLAPLQAGVYNLAPPRKYPSDYTETHMPQALKLVLAYLLELRAVRDTPVNLQQPAPPGTLRDSYLKQLADLEQKRKEGVLTVVDRINLGACLIRLGREAKAQEVLEESLRQVSGGEALRGLLLLNLAAACQEDDSLLQRALQLQREALKSWPALVPGWNRKESAWFRRVEQYVLTLMELRNREAILRGGRPPREQLPPDLLFPQEERDLAKKVQFVGESGEYEAGGIAWKQFERLPADADRIVLQLLLWRPSDIRLLWLYGELQNAQGKVDSSFQILNNQIRDQDQWRNRELDRHIRVLRDGLAAYRELFVDSSSGFGDNLRKQALLLWLLAPRGALLAPPLGAAVNEVGGVAAFADPADLNVERPSLRAQEVVAAEAAPSGTALPDWRQLGVSFVAGMVVALLWMFQWQQWRRHRRFAAARSNAVEHFPSPGDIAGTSRYSRPADG